MNRSDAVGLLRTGGASIGAIGVAIAITALPSGEPGGGFVEGLAVGLALVIGTLSLPVLAGSLAIPVPSDAVGGSVFRFSTAQRRLAAASFVLAVFALVVPLLLLVVQKDLVLALRAWLPLTGIGVLALALAVAWRGGEGVVRYVRRRT